MAEARGGQNPYQGPYRAVIPFAQSWKGPKTQNNLWCLQKPPDSLQGIFGSLEILGICCHAPTPRVGVPGWVDQWCELRGTGSLSYASLQAGPFTLSLQPMPASGAEYHFLPELVLGPRSSLPFPSLPELKNQGRSFLSHPSPPASLSGIREGKGTGAFVGTSAVPEDQAQSWAAGRPWGGCSLLPPPSQELTLRGAFRFPRRK